MWEVLSHSPEIVIGMERFIHKMMWGKLSPELYTEERFFEQQPNETWYDITQGKEGAYMPLARERWKKARYIGDKIPTLENHWDQLKGFNGGRIIYMVRDIWDVAASYKRRRDRGDPTWTAGGVEEAVRDWNLSLSNFHRGPSNFGVYVVNYDQFFRGTGYRTLWSWLELRQQEPLRRAHARISVSGRSLINLPKNFTDAEIDLIRNTADHETYRDIMHGGGALALTRTL